MSQDREKDRVKDNYNYIKANIIMIECELGYILAKINDKNIPIEEQEEHLKDFLIQQKNSISIG